LRLDPLVPFPDNQTPRSFLLHSSAKHKKRPPGGGLSAVALMGQQYRLRERPRPPVIAPSPWTQSKRDAQALLSQNACWTRETRPALPERHSAHSSFHGLLD
jgi:hypothetical protein